MTTAWFDPVGGPITVEVKCDPNRNGSYDIILWEANKNEVVVEFSGNFINTDDDKFDLSRPNAAHHGRLVEGMIVVAVPGGVGPSTVTMTVTQDGRVLANESGTVPPGSPGQLVDLFIMLEKE